GNNDADRIGRADVVVRAYVARSLVQLVSPSDFLPSKFLSKASAHGSIENGPIFLNQLHCELGHSWKRPPEFNQTLPQQGQIVSGCGAVLADSNQDHVFRYAKLIDREPHEHPSRRHRDADVEFMRASHTHGPSTRITQPLSPVLHRFV